MPVARCAAEEGHHHMRTERAHHTHHVAENGVLGPVRVRLFGVLAEAKVIRAREVLAPAINATRRQQLLGTDRAERFAEFVADKILSAVAAREREIRGFHMAALGQPRNNRRVFVVGVRGHREHAARGADAGKRRTQRGGTAVERDGLRQHGAPTSDKRRGNSRGAHHDLVDSEAPKRGHCPTFIGARSVATSPVSITVAIMRACSA